MSELGNHLWQSTVFALVAAVACFWLRNNPARVRFWLWLAASAKFLVPFSLLISIGAGWEMSVRMKATTVQPTLTALQVEQISTSFAPAHALTTRNYAPAGNSPLWPRVLLGVWLSGMLLFAGRWIRRWRTLHSLRRRATP